MHSEKYSFAKLTEKYYYEFYSKGPKGKIRKLVCFRLTRSQPFKVFNLSFGDASGLNEEIDDNIVTNNRDTQKVLQTVGAIAFEFLRHHHNVWIEVEGTTPARNRLYQMWIGKFWNDIDQYLTVVGKLDEYGEPFTKGINYNAFVFI